MCELETIWASDMIAEGQDLIFYRDVQCLVDGVVDGDCIENTSTSSTYPVYILHTVYLNDVLFTSDSPAECYTTEHYLSADCRLESWACEITEIGGQKAF